MFSGRGDDDFAEARDGDDKAGGAGGGGQEVPVADGAEAGFGVDADVASVKVGGDLLVPLLGVETSAQTPSLGQATTARMVESLTPFRHCQSAPHA